MPKLSLRVLGSIQILRDGEPVAGLESDKARALLIYLAVEAPRDHSRSAIAALLWPDQPAPVAYHNLRQALTNLRLCLGDRGTEQPFLRITRATIQLNPDSDYVLDVADFTTHLDVCDAHLHRRANTCQSCAHRRMQAVERYEGDFLASFIPRDSLPFEEWASLWRERLHQRALGAFAHLAVYSAIHGAYHEAQRYARRQVELEPWNEEAHQRLMHALWQTGQRSAALAQYEHCRRIIRQELGLDPMPETIALAQKIRSSEPEPAPVAQLPTPPTPFIGREAELAHLAELLDRSDCRLVTLSGPGGIGKTRLALRAAAAQALSFINGVHFVALAPLHTADLLASTIAAALKLVLDSRSDPESQLLRYLRDKDLLLVLDNMEHLLGLAGEVTALLAKLLERAPSVTILVTSRERLRLQGEWVMNVVGLPYPTGEVERTQGRTTKPTSTPAPSSINGYPALELFLGCARRAQPGFVLTADETHWVTRICQAVEGMPLGLELAAAWTHVLTCKEIALELTNSMTLLVGGPHDMPARHRSMWAVLDHSWRQLNTDERCVLRQLAVFRGGFEREAGEQVAGVSLTVLSSLVDKSLLRTNADTAGTKRFDLHELVRQYAEEQLHTAGEAEEILRRHAEYFLVLGETAERQVWGSEQATVWLDRLTAEHSNLRAAFAWSQSATGGCELGLRLAAALGRYWAWRGHLHEGRTWLQALLAQYAGEAAGGEDLAESRRRRHVRARALKEAGALLEMHPHEAEAYLQESVALFEELGNIDEAAQALWHLGHALWTRGDYDRAAHCIEASRQRYQAVGDMAGIGWADWLECNIAREQSDVVHAHALAEAALAHGRRSGQPILTAYAIHSLSRVQLARGAIRLARESAEEALAHGRHFQHPVFIAHALLQCGRVAVAENSAVQAIALWEEALAMVRDIHYRAMGEIQLELGWAEQWQGNHEQARVLLAESLRWYQKRGHQAYIAECLAGLAAVMTSTDSTSSGVSRAAQLLAAAQCLSAAVVRPAGHHDHRRTMDAMQARLGKTMFAAAWVEGQSMTIEEAVDQALGGHRASVQDGASTSDAREGHSHQHDAQ